MNKLSSLVLALGLCVLSSASWADIYNMQLCIQNITGYQSISYVYAGTFLQNPGFGNIASGSGFNCKPIQFQAIPAARLTANLGALTVPSDGTGTVTCPSGPYNVPSNTARIEMKISSTTCFVKYYAYDGTLLTK